MVKSKMAGADNDGSTRRVRKTQTYYNGRKDLVKPRKLNTRIP